MARFLTLLVLFLQLASSATAEGIDEVYVRPGNGWGIDVFGKMFNKNWFDRSYAIVIGVGDYTNYSKLYSPAHDAVSFRDFLINEAEFDYVVTLTDDKATKTRIENLMDQLIPNMIKGGDRVIFYFSGHGVTRQLGSGNRRGYLILKDAGNGAWDTMIDMPRLMEWAQNVDAAQHVLFVIDACFSGLAAYQVKAPSVYAKTIERLSQPAHHIVTAGVESEESYSFDGESIFTAEFLAAARGQLSNASDGIMSLTEIMFNVSRAIDRRSVELGQRIKMTPHMYATRLEDNSGEFFFLTNSKTQPPRASPALTSGVESKSGVPKSQTSTQPVVPSAPPDEVAWDSVSSSRDAKEIESFIARFPTSRMRSRAEALLQQLKIANLTPSTPALPPAALSPPLPAQGGPPTVRERAGPAHVTRPTPRGRNPALPLSGHTNVRPKKSSHFVRGPGSGSSETPRLPSAATGGCFTFNGNRYCD